MATMAAFVLGLDLDQELIAYARATWQKPNLRFEHHDLHEPIRLTELAGLVTSFETLEHVRDPHRCLSNLANALADEGLAIVSVPNGIKELHSARPKDYHQVHFTADEFHRLLTEQFEWVEERSELFQPSLGYRLGKLLGKKGHLAKYYRFVPGFLDQAKTWLALCRSPRRR
jgi:2-polyprenyl-3-methyl-5-hydroxy-6-metoxy-1,4-benzoquinol methylase